MKLVKIKLVNILITQHNTNLQFKVTNSLFYGRVPNAQRIRAAAHVSPGDLCDATALKCGLCDNLMFAIFGYNAPQVNNAREL